MPHLALNPGTVMTAALAWLAVLFAVAVLAERRPGVLAGYWKHIYALSLAVHCTSWAFYGTVTQAGSPCELVASAPGRDCGGDAARLGLQPVGGRQ